MTSLPSIINVLIFQPKSLPPLPPNKNVSILHVQACFIKFMSICLKSVCIKFVVCSISESKQILLPIDLLYRHKELTFKSSASYLIWRIETDA